MNRYDEIKNLLNSSRKMLSKENLNETNNILNKYYSNLLNESVEDNNDDDVEDQDNNDELTPEVDKETRKSEKSKTYRITGGLVTIYSDDKRQTELTTDDKRAFQESMDEFVNDITELVDFNKMNIYKDNVEWSGKITEYDVDFFISIGENNGIYIKSEMLKLDEEFVELVAKLREYFEKFKARWSKVIAIRKKTPQG
jgi:sulfur relay (sulfurtransferase) DsrC/TusE family protein